MVPSPEIRPLPLSTSYTYEYLEASLEDLLNRDMVVIYLLKCTIISRYHTVSIESQNFGNQVHIDFPFLYNLTISSCDVSSLIL
jgi:hypothetical protein